MKIKKACNLACPLDGEPLDFHEKQLVCANKHAFDVARRGYVNLLPVQHKRSKQPGDNKRMVIARTQFLGSGVYEPIAAKLTEIASGQISDKTEWCLLDAGCGEGYYIDYVFNRLKSMKGGCEISFIGLDISKAAISEAAKRNKLITWVVGTNKQPPVAYASVDIVLCVFGFHSFKGFRRILKPEAKVVIVEPGPDHLKELREIIYAEVKISDPQDVFPHQQKGYEMVDRQLLRFKAENINNEQINDLLLMTPHFFRATKKGKEVVTNLHTINLTIDVVFKTFETT